MQEFELQASKASVDALAEQVLRYAAFCARRGVPRAVVTEAFLRAAVAIVVVDLGTELAAVREAAEQLAESDDSGAPSACQASTDNFVMSLDGDQRIRSA